MGKRAEQQFERRPRGFYPTPWAAFEPLEPYLSRTLCYGEPCAGDGTLCGHMDRVGLSITLATDIAPRHPWVTAYDALALTPADIQTTDLFVTNPPWPEKGGNGEPTLGILMHLSGLRTTWALLPSDFMFNAYAGPIMARCTAVLPIGRVQWIPGSEHNGKDNCAWFRFELGSSGSGIQFIPRVARKAGKSKASGAEERAADRSEAASLPVENTEGSRALRLNQ